MPPSRNYPDGWLTTAYGVIRAEPQIRALCWFMDYIPNDTQWEWFSLTQGEGQVRAAAAEFEALLQQ